MHTVFGGLIPAHSSTELKGSSLIGTPRSFPPEDGCRTSSTIRTQRGLMVDCSEFTEQRPPSTQQSRFSDCECSPTGSNLMRRSGYGRGVPSGNASKSAAVRIIPLSHPKNCDVTEGYGISFEDALSSVCSFPSGIGIYVLLSLQTGTSGTKILQAFDKEILSRQDKVQPMPELFQVGAKERDSETRSSDNSIDIEEKNSPIAKEIAATHLLGDCRTQIAVRKETLSETTSAAKMGESGMVCADLRRLRKSNKGKRNYSPRRSHYPVTREECLRPGCAVESPTLDRIREFSQKQQVRSELRAGVDY